jgi:hypothetical protein
MQNGRPLAVSMTEYNGNKYALVRAVPDRGEVSLTKGVTTRLFPKKIPQQNDTKTGTKAAIFDLHGHGMGSARLNASGLISTDRAGGPPTGIYLIKVEGAIKFQKKLIVR